MTTLKSTEACISQACCLALSHTQHACKLLHPSKLSYALTNWPHKADEPYLNARPDVSTCSCCLTCHSQHILHDCRQLGCNFSDHNQHSMVGRQRCLQAKVNQGYLSLDSVCGSHNDILLTAQPDLLQVRLWRETWSSRLRLSAGAALIGPASTMLSAYAYVKCRMH